MADHFSEYRGRYVLAALTLLVVGGNAYIKFQELRSQWQYDAMQVQEEVNAYKTYQSGNAAPLRALLSSRLSSLRQRREFLEQPSKQMSIQERTNLLVKIEQEIKKTEGQLRSLDSGQGS